MKSRILFAFRMAWTAYKARSWAMVADVAIVAGIIWWLA